MDEVYCHCFGAFRQGVLGELIWKQKPDGVLDCPRLGGGSLVVVSQTLHKGIADVDVVRLSSRPPAFLFTTTFPTPIFHPFFPALFSPFFATLGACCHACRDLVLLRQTC